MDNLQIGIGFSKIINPEECAQEAALQARRLINADHADLVLCMTTVHYPPQQILPIIGQHLNPTKMMGCSTTSLILPESIESRGIAIIALRSKALRCGLGYIEKIDTLPPQQVGEELALHALQDYGKESRQFLLLFIDGKFQQFSNLLKGTQSILGNVFSIVGAGSCDNAQLTEHFQIHQTNASRNSVTGLLLGGLDGTAVTGCHGWRPLGKPRVVTHSTYNVIHTINNKTAFKLYEEYFGPEEAQTLFKSPVKGLAAFYPLGIYIQENNNYLLRNAIDIQTDGSIVCQGEVPEHSEIHIMIGNKEACQKAAIQAAKECKAKLLGRKIKLVIVLESATRLRLFGRSASDEIQMISHVFGKDIPLIGMYTQGEIFPFKFSHGIERAHLQNESIIILALT